MRGTFAEIDRESLKTRIESKGISHQAIARSLAIHQKSVQRWLNGSVRRIKYETLEKLSDLLECPLDGLVTTNQVLRFMPKDTVLEALLEKSLAEHFHSLENSEAFFKLLLGYLDKELPVDQELQVHYHLSRCYLYLGRTQEGRHHIDIALRMSKAVQNPAWELRSLMAVAYFTNSQGELVKSQEVLQQALIKAQGTAFVKERHDISQRLAFINAYQGQLPEAKKFQRHALYGKGADRDPSVTLFNKYFQLGLIEMKLGSFKRASALYEISRKQAVTLKNDKAVAYAHYGQCWIALLSKDIQAAAVERRQAARFIQESTKGFETTFLRVEFFWHVFNNDLQKARSLVIERLWRVRHFKLHVADVAKDLLLLEHISQGEFKMSQKLQQTMLSVFTENGCHGKLSTLEKIRGLHSLEDLLASESLKNIC